MMKITSLSETEQQFILHWGQMGVEWGINRTVAQVHALLFIAPEPLHAEAICEILAVARSNVSNSLKELQGWGIVHKVPKLGDKRDHFTSVQDVWELARIILNERKKREINPTLHVLKTCVEQARSDGVTSPHSAERLRELSRFLESASSWFEHMNRLPTSVVKTLMKLG